MFDLIGKLLATIVGDPIQTGIAIIVAIIVVSVFQARRNKRAAEDFEAAYGFKPDSHLDPLHKVVYLTLNEEWKKVEQARNFEDSALSNFREGKTPAEILGRRDRYEQVQEESSLIHDEFGLKLKLAIKFGYVSEQSYRELEPAIKTFAEKHSFYATA